MKPHGELLALGIGLIIGQKSNVVGAVVVWLLLVGSATAVQAATASWNANPEADIAGYILSYGTVSGTYTQSINVGNVTTVLVPLTPGIQYFFVVQAYNTSALTSPFSAEVSFTVDPGAPIFTTQPISQSITSGQNTSFTVAANGAPAPTFKWQFSTNGGSTWTDLTNTAPYSGVTTATLTVTNAAGSLTLNQYRAVASSSTGNVPSNAAVLTVTVPVAPAITAQPVSSTILAGQNTSFTVAASGTPAPTFQWQLSTNNGASFTDLTNVAPYSGVTTTTLTLTNVAAGLNTARYRAVATNLAGSATSNAAIPAILTVNVPPAITTQPISHAVTAGQNTTFVGAATGQPAPTLQWQLSTNAGASWTDLTNTAPYSGVTTATMTLTNIPAGLTGNLYRLVANNSTGTTPSTGATLTVNVPPAITTPPVSQTVNNGQNASFTVVATGAPAPTYQWQISTDSGVSFTNLTNTAPYSGTTTAALTITAVAGGLNGAQYRAIATNVVGSATSSAATLTVFILIAPAITTQPVNQVVTVGLNGSFTVAASGNPAPTYRWQISTNGGGSFVNLSNVAPYSGATSATLTLTGVTAGLTGAQYRAVATNVVSSATSNAATLTVNTGAPIFTLQPANQSVNVGLNASFTVAASATPAPTFQWQISTDAGVSFTNLTNTVPYSNVTTTTLTVTGVVAGLNGALFRAVATNSFGSVSSNAATLAVNIAPTITTQPTNQTVTAGLNGAISVVASGTPAASYQWQVSTDNGASFANLTNAAPYSGVTTATLVLTNVTLVLNGNQYRSVATNVAGTATSNAAILTIIAPPTITLQPAAVVISVGQNASFATTASGNPSPTYQWQVSTNGGGSFTNLTNAAPYSGVTTTTLALTGAAAGLNGNLYRAVATNSAGTANSNAVLLTVNSPPAITSQPTDLALTTGQTAAFTVVATGQPAPTYQWQASSDFGLTWTNLVVLPTATSATLTLTATDWWNYTEFRCVLTNAGGSATSNPVILTVYGRLTASPTSLAFSATKTAASATLSNVTPAQSTMVVGFTGAGTSWTAVANQTWLQVTGGSGFGPGQFTVRIVNPGNVIGASTVLSGTITVTAAVSGNFPVMIPVTLLVTQTLNALPLGSIDTPSSGTTGVQGSVALSGWSLAAQPIDAIDHVEIWRDVVQGETTQPYQGAGLGHGKIFVTNAPLIGGARPDIEAQFEGDPGTAQAGWGALVLTRGLSSVGDGWYTLYAIAYDTAGRSAILGTTTIAVDNAHATEPFGTIDTPGEAATVSGTISVAGWALTPGAACTISPTGVSASIDSAPLISVLYGQARPDIATAFPGFTNSNNAGGALVVDTTTLANGTHQIAWSVTDSCGRQAWIGTRFFTVSNGGASTLATGGQLTSVTAQTSTTPNWEPVSVRQDEAGSWSLVYPNANGVRVVPIDEGHSLEVQLPSLGGATYAGYHSVGDQWRPLPLGSSLAGQVFSWAPAAGFLGSYDLAFVATSADGSQQLVSARIVVGPSARLWIEPPPADANLAQPFELTGWTLDLAAPISTGIDTVQVRAAPAGGGPLIMLGNAVNGESWPVVAAMFGAQFMNSGFRITVNGLPPGTYDLVVSAYATPYGPLRGTKTVRVTVH